MGAWIRFRRRVRAGPAGVCALTALLLGEATAAQEYHVDLEAPRSVVFISAATLDEFEGVTERIDGFVFLAGGGGVGPAPDLAGSRLFFEVDLASLDTGISLRNRHMRDNYLETDEHPYATFDGKLDRIEAAGPGRFNVRASGDFAVHGVAARRTLDCLVTEERGGHRVACAFPVRLEDHDIEIPRIMFMKLAPEVRVEIDFRVQLAGRPSPDTVP